MLLIYTGYKRTAHDIAKGYVSKLQKSKKSQIIEISKQIVEIALTYKVKNFTHKIIHRVHFHMFIFCPLHTQCNMCVLVK